MTVVIHWQGSPLSDCCVSEFIIAMFQDINNVVCLVGISWGLQGVFLSPRFPPVT